MTSLVIVRRPTIAQLRQSRKDGTTCYFRVRPSGTNFAFRLNGTVVGIGSEGRKDWRTVDFMESDSGESLLLAAAIDVTDNRAGSLDWMCAHEDTRLQWCGVDPATWKLLASHDINCLGDLKLYDERGICERLLPPEVPLIQSTVEDAIQRYLRMRSQLRRFQVYNPCGQPDPSTQQELRATVYSG